MRSNVSRSLSLLAVAVAASVASSGPALNAGEVKLGLTSSAAKVGKFGLVEFRIQDVPQLPRRFDPAEADVTLRIECPSGAKIVLPGFYCQDYERKRLGQGGPRADWIYPVGIPGWKARFAPMEIGTHRVTAVVTSGDGSGQSPTIALECVPSTSKGFLRISKQDPRFFESSEGQPFFAIGQNLAFIGEGQYVTLSKAEEIFGTLSANGANYLRIWTCCEDWAMAIEARKSAWGRSWNWRPPIVPTPDAEGPDKGHKCIKMPEGDGKTLEVSPSHPVALRPNIRYAVTGRIKSEGQAAVRLQVQRTTLQQPLRSGQDGGWTAFRHEFTTSESEYWLGGMSFRREAAGNVWLNDLSLKEAAGGPELLWEADVNRPIRGFYNPLDSFMLDQLVADAEKRGLYLQLCLATRDLYMSSLKNPESPEYQQAIEDAKRLFRYAVARWGYSTSVAAWEYFNEMDPGLPTDRFYAELGTYLEQIDPYRHLRTTSTWGPSPKDCRHPKLDIADVHFYLRPADKGRIKDEVEAVADRTRFLRENAPAKPAHLGEFGMADNQWRPTPDMQRTDQLADFHNGLWASALSGCSGTAMFWWWDIFDRKNHYPRYKPLATFLDDVPWTTARLRPAAATVAGDKARLVGLQGADRAYLWLFNPEASWGKLVLERAAPQEIRDAQLELKDLPPGNYRVVWWDTWEGKVIKEEKVVPIDGNLRLTAPPFTRDVACKITR